MAKSTRLFEIIQMLRAAKSPLLARDIAAQLEVSVRTVYRDIASLQAMRTPIYGEAGIGYVMRKGYDLPPLNLNVEEAEAIAVGLTLVARTGDAGLWRAAGQAARKLEEVAPATQRLVTSACGVEDVGMIDLAAVRAAIRTERKMMITYRDANDQSTDRVIWPLVLIYYVNTANIIAWCELRQSLRSFRLERVTAWSLSEDSFVGEGERLRSLWEATEKMDAVTTRAM
ncbi:MAG: YafY family protein [Pseudomonadota bacterium]